MPNKSYDVIIIGAGSVGAPSALFMVEAGLSVLVIDQMPSVGQASNKHAIGGIRATHSDPAKIALGNQSLSVFSTFQEKYGDDIEWHKGGYSFVAYDSEHEKMLKDLVVWQQNNDLNIHWVSAEKLLEIVPHLNPDNLLGGTYSPDDGSASPLMSAFAFHKHAVEAGAEFHFSETVTDILMSHDRVIGVRTNKNQYHAEFVINAAGGWAGDLSEKMGIPLPVKPDSHEAAITEPIARIFQPMIVDMRPRPGSANFYFYQHPTGKVIFCMTPDPPILGNHTTASSGFLPKAAKRLIEVMPILKHIRVRRTWRGTYPMTPDGSPILGKVGGVSGYLLAAGMCGQGFMFGPGIAQLLTHLILNKLDDRDKIILQHLSYRRKFQSVEKLK